MSASVDRPAPPPGPVAEGEPPVRLAIPASSRFLRLARLTAAGIAGDLGYSLQEIEDLRVAVDEACALLIDGCQDPAAEVELRYVRDGDSLLIEGRCPCEAEADVDIHPVAQELLRLTTDEFQLHEAGSERSFRLVKHRQDPPG